MKKIVCLLVSILLVAALTAAGFAQSDFPKKEITIIVPFSAGGATDLMARSLQPIFKELLDVNIVVEDVAGGGSVTGITQAMTSKNDGYTLGLVTSSYIALAAQGQVPIMPEMFTNITSLSEDPLCVVVKSAKNGGKYSSIQDLLDDAIARPGEVIISQAGNNNFPPCCLAFIRVSIGGLRSNINMQSFIVFPYFPQPTLSTGAFSPPYTSTSISTTVSRPYLSVYVSCHPSFACSLISGRV